MSGTESQVGAKRAFTCDGSKAWSDGTIGWKPVYCQADGTWTRISFSCLSIFIFFFPNSFLRKKSACLKEFLGDGFNFFAKIVEIEKVETMEKLLWQ